MGEDKIAKRPAALDIEYGAGRVILIGFRAQHRAQTHGTFTVFFNALHYGASEQVRLGEVAAGATRP